MESLVNLDPRPYQKSIFETCKEKNCLVILPTGIGKTAISLLLTVHRLNQFSDSKALICAPTKPLCNQHVKTFKENTTIDNDDIILYTGLIKPSDRINLFNKSRVIIATPQTIEKDIENNRISLENFSTLTIDEAHRSRQSYANTTVTKSYLKQSKNPRVLALTASPGSSKEKITEIVENLGIETLEIRDEESEDVKEHVQKRNIEFIELDLPKEFRDILDLVKSAYKDRVTKLRNYGLTKPASIVNKRDVLNFQRYLQFEIKKGNKSAFWGISLTAQAIKITHALELLETQGLRNFHKFILGLESETSKAAKSIMSDQRIKKALSAVKSFIDEGREHPKLNKLKETVRNQLEENSDSKIIIFATYRDTVRNIIETLKDIKKARPIELIGQKEGITQKKQLETIRLFEEGKYNIIVGTSVSEEGISLGQLDIAIFYDQAPGGIRSIQRAGRVSRVKAGKIIHLITKNTRDQAYYWKSLSDIKKMKNIVSKIKSEKQSKLQDNN